MRVSMRARPLGLARAPLYSSTRGDAVVGPCAAHNKDRKEGGGLKTKVRFAGIEGIYTDGLAEDDWPAAYEAMRYLPTPNTSP